MRANLRCERTSGLTEPDLMNLNHPKVVGTQERSDQAVDR